MATDSDIHSDLAIPPGEYLEEVVETLGMTKDELARRMARPASKLSPIFRGEKAITPDTALQLEKVVGVPAHVWLGLESEYRLALAREQGETEAQQLRGESRLVAAYCYPQLVKAGVVAKTTKPIERVRELQRFFGVASLLAIPNVQRYQAALRQGTSNRHRRSPEAVAAWLRLAETRATQVDTKPYDSARLREALNAIRGMTRREPKAFLPELSALLAEAGVALVLLPHFPGTRAHGATFRAGRDRAILALTIRGSCADIFWFSLFHELGHILLHDKRDVIIESDDIDPTREAREAQADAFARDTLIPPPDYARLVARRDLMPQALRAFADEIGIAPGIVVGRLQYDAFLKHEWHNDLRARYAWAEDVA
ncbi:MAG TPA: HigA family addiction module antitoxin [Gaiellaceae bacterium]